MKPRLKTRRDWSRPQRGRRNLSDDQRSIMAADALEIKARISRSEATLPASFV
jgi:hypothetical protein